MSLTVVWSTRIEADLKRIPWRDAAAVAAAVLDYAATGKGRIRRVDGAPANERSLVVGSYFVRLVLDRASLTLTALFLYRLR